MSGDHNMYQKDKSYLDFECPRCGHCCQGYELGFVDGMQHQMQLSVKINKEPTKIFGPNLEEILNRAGFYKKQWVGLTDEEIAQGLKESWVTEQAWQSAVWWAEAKLKEKNNGH